MARVLCLFLLLTGWVWARGGPELPVLCYHQIAYGHLGDDMTITPERFEAHMDYLARHGYRPINLNQARLFLWGRKPLKGKPILITFDDGYGGVCRYGLPVLQKYHFPAVVFMVVGHIGDVTSHTPHLTLPQLKLMQASGLFEFGSHTYDLHCQIPQRLNQGGIYPHQVLKDLEKSRSELHRLLGVEPIAFAWPYGHYSARCLQLASRAGFSMQFCTDYGVNRPFDGTLRIRRLRVSSDSNNVALFEGKLQQKIH